MDVTRTARGALLLAMRPSGANFQRVRRRPEPPDKAQVKLRILGEAPDVDRHEQSMEEKYREKMQGKRICYKSQVAA